MHISPLLYWVFQEDVFQLVGVPLVEDALAGYNASILSYGQVLAALSLES